MPRSLDLTLPARSALTTLRMRWRMRRGVGRTSPYAALGPITLSSVFGQTHSSREILRLARRCLISRALIALDHLDLERGGRCHEVKHVEPLLDLKRRGIGAVVCSMHVGPYYYIPLELGRRGFDQVVFAVDLLRDRQREPWEAVIRHLPGRVEMLPAMETHSLIRALRALERGWTTVIYMDGQTGVGGPGGGRHHSVEVELLSLTVRLRIGPAYLAQRARVPLVLAAARRSRSGHRSIEFSDPIPPPERGGHEARVECVRSMVPWFEERIRRDLDQWNGWFYPLLTWSKSGGAPTASREELERTRARVSALIVDRRRRAALRADPARVAAIDHEGSRALIHGPTRRILEASPLSSELLKAALRGVRMSHLPRLFPVERAELVHEVTRMVLAELATIEGDGGV